MDKQRYRNRLGDKYKESINIGIVINRYAAESSAQLDYSHTKLLNTAGDFL